MVESRRFFLNFVVGCTGIVTCLLMIFCAIWAESAVDEAIGLPDGPLLGMFGIFLYRLLANVFFTGGWICELIVRTEVTAETANAFGLKAFRIGVQFSIFITLCPAAICWLLFAVAVEWPFAQIASPPRFSHRNFRPDSCSQLRENKTTNASTALRISPRAATLLAW